MNTFLPPPPDPDFLALCFIKTNVCRQMINSLAEPKEDFQLSLQETTFEMLKKCFVTLSISFKIAGTDRGDL